MVDTSIVNTLGAGSGIDIRSLVSQLAAAARGPADAQIASRSSRNSARISALAEVSGGISDFAASLAALVSSGGLSSKPSVSEPSLLSATAIAGATLRPGTAIIEIGQLASAQTLASQRFAAPETEVGTGSLIFAFADRNFSVTVGAGDNSVTGLAAAINAANGGVTASLVTDTTGTRLVLRGASGEAQAFSVSAAPDASPGLESFAYSGSGSAMTLSQAASDAIIEVDGIEVRSTSNSFASAIPGVQIDLKNAGSGQRITIGIERPAAALATAVGDFVSAYNALMSRIGELTANRPGETAGPARGDTAISTLRAQLARLPGQALSASATGPKTLAEIGVKTNRDGTLAVDSARLAQIVASDPAAVEALFIPPGSTSPATDTTGLPAALRAMRESLTGSSGPFTSANQRLSAEAKRISEDRAVLERRSEKFSAQLLATFTAMDRRVSAFKSTQSFLDQQIAVWASERQ